MFKNVPLKKHFLFLITLSIVLSLFTAFKAHMNNWLIFKASFFHLLDGTNLYVLYPDQHNDLFKYSPSFALLMAPLALLPAWLGATLWNLLGAILFIYALIKMPISDIQRKGIFWISLPEFIGSTQGFQSNIHLVAFLFLFWIALEEKQSIDSVINILLSFFIKIFGILGGALLIYDKYSTGNPQFLFRLIWQGLVTLIILCLLPLPFIGWDNLMFQYSEWLRLLKMDAAESYGFSLMGIIYGISGVAFDKLPVQIMGGVTLLISLFCYRKTNQTGRMLGLIAVCYFMILFNHKSESPTFIIAMMAFGLHQSLIDNKKLRWGLIIFTLGCVSLLYSDLFRHIKQSHFDPIAIKAWPFVILYPMALLHLGVKKTTK